MAFVTAAVSPERFSFPIQYPGIIANHKINWKYSNQFRTVALSMQIATDDRAGDEPLSVFKYDILFVLAEGENYGAGIKDGLMAYYGTDVNPSRLYPNLDELAIEGLIDKQSYSRVNNYSITEDGRRAIADRLAWAIQQVVEGDEAKRLQRIIEQELELG